MKTKHDITKAILKKIRLVEQESDYDRYDPEYSESDYDEDVSDSDRGVLDKSEENFRKFLLNGSVVQISGIDATELEFTETEKEAFKSSMQGFITNITDLVEFKILNISSTNIEWVGELTQENIEWVYSLDDQNGCYLSANMLQLTDDTVQIISKVKQNYKEWSATWGKILSDRRVERRKKIGKSEAKRI
jgi:hypothetical protein